MNRDWSNFGYEVAFLILNHILLQVLGREESKYNPEVAHRSTVVNSLLTSTFLLIFQYETTAIHETQGGEKTE
jgi:hypothetical protein